MASENIIDVNEADFEYEVLNYSQATPVVVDFWAPWCIPCKTLGPLLERLAEEAHGNFRLARVNVDENQALAIRYGVRSIPAVKAFEQGQVVKEFVGAQPEPRVREFVRSLAPSPGDLLTEKGNSMLQAHQWVTAERSFRQGLEKNPGRADALLGLAKSLIAQGRAKEALGILNNFPASREFHTSEVIRPLAEALRDLGQAPGGEEDALAAAYRNSLRLVNRGNYPAALDGLLDILRQDKAHRSGAARQTYLGILELMGEEDPQTRQYRAELASVLF